MWLFDNFKLRGFLSTFLLLTISDDYKGNIVDSFILTCFHYGRTVVADSNCTYKDELDIFVIDIDKVHYSLLEYFSYTKDLKYSKMKGFYTVNIQMVVN